jgi:hypothetical protein
MSHISAHSLTSKNKATMTTSTTTAPNRKTTNTTMIDDPHTDALLEAYQKLVDREGWIKREIQAEEDLRLACSAPNVIGNRLHGRILKSKVTILQWRLDEVTKELFVLENQLWEIDAKRDEARRRGSYDS